MRLRKHKLIAEIHSPRRKIPLPERRRTPHPRRVVAPRDRRPEPQKQFLLAAQI